MTEKTDATALADRYIAAVVRTVPEKQRGDVANELRDSIYDQIDARIEAGEERDAAERAVLEGLGDPDALGAGYADRPLHLIGPRYYLTWKRLLVLLLWIMVPLAVFGVALGMSIAGEPIGAIIGTTVQVGIGTALHMCFWVTLVFAVIERYSRGTDVAVEWTLDELPEPPESGATRSDLVWSLGLLALAAGLVVWDHVFGAAYLSGTGWISVLHPGLWPVWLIVLWVFLAIEAAIAVAVFVAGRWTTGLAVTNGILNLLFATAAIWLLVRGELLNPAFWPALIPDGDSAATVATIIPILVGFTVVGVNVWDTIDAFRKARRAAR
ncbi:permease prefix domain 1-containing protein [Microbacterium sp. No. 7]|uniref:permease prefix domain 1-containing protein n=1 Tax=Microbacterium sp. No. 7 TaxID=1714373 RepID=UPI0006D10A54|nr:permease prefix domain 1-containing protein [Microbacterium sp. No. 7]ALJ21478.1 hypothetical protein AOA12_16905 [Microbacterium sp. No. 7]